MTLTSYQKRKMREQAKRTADRMINGPTLESRWYHIITFDKSIISRKSVDRLVDALGIHYEGVCFGINSEGNTYSLDCDNKRVAILAREYCQGWEAK